MRRLLSSTIVLGLGGLASAGIILGARGVLAHRMAACPVGQEYIFYAGAQNFVCGIPRADCDNYGGAYHCSSVAPSTDFVSPPPSYLSTPEPLSPRYCPDGKALLTFSDGGNFCGWPGPECSMIGSGLYRCPSVGTSLVPLPSMDEFNQSFSHANTSDPLGSRFLDGLPLRRAADYSARSTQTQRSSSDPLGTRFLQTMPLISASDFNVRSTPTRYDDPLGTRFLKDLPLPGTGYSKNLPPDPMTCSDPRCQLMTACPMHNGECTSFCFCPGS